MLVGKRVLIAKLNSRGDTIVEVLIAVGIMSLVLTSAYALTNSNSASSQKTQEQMIALKLAEEQVEQLLGDTTSPTVTGCYDQTNTFVPLTANCTLNGQGDVFDAVADGGAEYDMTISRSASGIYEVRATWDALSGQTAHVALYVKRAN